MKRIIKDKRGEIVCYLAQAILNKKDFLADIVWDEHCLGELLEEYFEGYEIHLIPKKTKSGK